MNALDKVFAILEAFLDEGEPLRLSDLSEKTGLNKSTVRVIASGLVDKGYLVQNSKRGRYFLGLKFMQYAQAVEKHLSVRQVATPYLRELLDQVNETSELVMRDGLVATVVASFEPDRLLSVSSAGKWAARLPLHQTACGKVLLAHIDPEEWEQVRDQLELWPGSPKTIATLDELERHLALVRQSGIAVDDEEAEMGIRSIAAPVRDGGGRVIAAIDIVGPKLRLTDEAMDEFKPLVQHCALSISKALGYGAL